MNEIFSKFKVEKLVLEEGYSLSPDGFKGLVLQYEVERTREKKDGTKEKYTDLKQWYYPTISKTLLKYLELKTVEAKSIEELKDIVLRVEDKINTIKEKWE